MTKCISFVLVFAAALAAGCARPGATRQDALASAANSSGKVHTYFVAADEVDWDYAPDGMDKMMGMKFAGYGAMFMTRGPHSIGRVYRKAIYREYTDASFSTLKSRTPEWQHLGILGPVLRAEVGDTIRVVFRNNGTRPYSMHPHGVFYNKDSEGAVYDDGSSAADKANSVVPPGQTHLYTWEVPERAGPGPADGSSVVWLYHSHVNEQRDVNSGLIGPIIITARGMAGPDGRPTDVDREFVSLFMIFDENVSWFLDQNIQTFTTDPKHVKKLQGVPATRMDSSLYSAPASRREFSIKYQRLHVRERTHDDYEKGRARALVPRNPRRAHQYSYPALAWKRCTRTWTAHRCSRALVCRNAVCGHGARQSRNLDVPLPFRRPHEHGYGRALQG